MNGIPEEHLGETRPEKNTCTTIGDNKSTSDEALFVSQCLQKLEFPCKNQIVERLVQYTTLIMEYNQRVNLISRVHREFRTVFMEHVYDSLLGISCIMRRYDDFLKAYPGEEFRVVDIGSGAGLPGIPLACVCENMFLALCESKLKKIVFLKEVCKKLQLNQIEVIHQNVREIHGTYDIITARAFGSIPKIYKTTKHLLQLSEKTSALLLYKGQRSVVAKELNEFRDMVKSKDRFRIQTHVLSVSTEVKSDDLTNNSALVEEQVVFNKERTLVEIEIKPASAVTNH